MHHADGRVVSNFIIQALRGEPITIFGKGDQSRSFCYVDDLIEAIIRLMDTDAQVTGPINLGNPFEFTILELAEQIIKKTGSSSEIVFQPLPEDDPKQRRPNIALANELLGWQPRVALNDGLDLTIAYFENLLPELHAA
jgi:UDP-glucuronate decarboxylase